jgi:hypothetical protein
LLSVPGGLTVLVGEAEFESSQNAVHKALKRLCGIAQVQRHEGEFEKAEWIVNGRLLYIIRMDGDMIVRSRQVDLGDNVTPVNLVGEIVNMTDWIEVRDYPGIECSAIAARAPTVVFLGYDV